MKSFIYLPNLVIDFLIVFGLLIIVTSTTAQSLQYRDLNDPGKGYWKLFTDAATRTTSVKFYDGKHKLLYEEEIPNKYIKLTNRNINKINQVFDLITGNQQISAKVKSVPLPATPERRIFKSSGFQNAASTRANLPEVNFAGSAIIFNDFKVVNTAKYHLIFKLPTTQKIEIYLKNKVGKILYYDKVNTASYYQIFDFTDKELGSYRFEIHTKKPKSKYVRNLTLRLSVKGSTNQTIDVEPSGNTYQSDTVVNF